MKLMPLTSRTSSGGVYQEPSHHQPTVKLLKRLNKASLHLSTYSFTLFIKPTSSPTERKQNTRGEMFACVRGLYKQLAHLPLSCSIWLNRSLPVLSIDYLLLVQGSMAPNYQQAGMPWHSFPPHTLCTLPTLTSTSPTWKPFFSWARQNHNWIEVSLLSVEFHVIFLHQWTTRRESFPAGPP